MKKDDMQSFLDFIGQDGVQFFTTLDTSGLSPTPSLPESSEVYNRGSVIQINRRENVESAVWHSFTVDFGSDKVGELFLNKTEALFQWDGQLPIEDVETTVFTIIPGILFPKGSQYAPKYLKSLTEFSYRLDGNNIDESSLLLVREEDAAKYENIMQDLSDIDSLRYAVRPRNYIGVSNYIFRIQNTKDTLPWTRKRMHLSLARADSWNQELVTWIFGTMWSEEALATIDKEQSAKILNEFIQNFDEA